ncbi:zona pellucida sperm-binding protein 3-like [Dunckerocampus dactyliophorus]|uniref:zona pellucida sperm-binding protein 3-like n=1 Tax=Dunckerocampus dactyliophorus TaxID=161453 RepID=UPI002406389C|nr:zona pellucida sperm-binding protein 3-like [Dunckerocampus dactyliophorus]
MNHKSRTCRCWSFVLLVVFTTTESQYASYEPPKAQGPSRTSFGFVQSPFSIQKHNIQSKPVTVKCHSDAIEVVVQADLFDTGLLLDPEHLHLGLKPAIEGRSCRASQTSAGTLTILADLLDCGTRLSSTGDMLIYSNVLVYSPKPSSDGLIQLDGAAIPVECHFDKRYSVDGVSLQPSWVPSVSVASAHHHIAFHLRLMTDNWQFVRRSHTYYLGDLMHFEASAVVRKHKPLRVYVDHCVATDTPDPQATLRYDFIARNGCLTDAFLTNSSSHFLSRLEEHTLRFQLDAFRFHQGPSSQVYITCWLRAVPVTSAISSQNRACSFVGNRWRSVDGEDQVCRTCDHLAVKEETTIVGETEQSTNSKQNFALNKPKHLTSSLQVRPRMFPGHKSQLSSEPMTREVDSKTERIVQLGPLTVK